MCEAIIGAQLHSPSYGKPYTPLSTNYGVPLANPLTSYDTTEDSIAEQDSDDSDMELLYSAVPGVPGEDYPILASVDNAGNTGFTCQDRIPGGK